MSRAMGMVGNGGEAGRVKTNDSVGVKDVGRKQGLDGSLR